MKERFLALMGFSVHRHSLKTEIVSGLTTFTTMVYILALLPAMMEPLRALGFPVDTVFTASILATIVGTLLMAFLAKRPFGQAPGLTLNIFFIQTVCLSLGYPWQFALTAVLIEGILFVLLCIGNLRQLIFELVPSSLKYAIAAGIGFFIAMLGFKSSGMLADGTVFNHLETLSTPAAILFLIGLMLTGLFAILRIKGGLLLGIVSVTLIGIPMGVTTVPDDVFSMPVSPAPLFCQFSSEFLLQPDLWVCVLIMLFFDVFDSLGTIVGIMACTGLMRKNGRIPHLRSIMLSDALCDDLCRECHRICRGRSYRCFCLCCGAVFHRQSVSCSSIPVDSCCSHCACDGHGRSLSLWFCAPYLAYQYKRDVAGFSHHLADACHRKYH